MMYITVYAVQGVALLPWHVGEDVPMFPKSGGGFRALEYSDLLDVQADGDELSWLIHYFSPNTLGPLPSLPVVVFVGNFAQQIIANMPAIVLHQRMVLARQRKD
jgi:hypothetical protein